MKYVDPDHLHGTYDTDLYHVQDERQGMNKGWLVKARHPEQPGPNVSWYWIPLGNCLVCEHYSPAQDLAPPECLHPDISQPEFLRYLHVNTCPVFRAGLSERGLEVGGEHERLLLDVLRAAGLAEGEPSEAVEILQQLAWTPWRSHQAHYQQEQFRTMARAHDAGHEPYHGDYGDDLGPIDASEEAGGSSDDVPLA